jgi:hypothetical protein
MLVNLLSRKSFFTEIILGVLFFTFFIWKNAPFTTNWQDILGLVCFLGTILISILFFHHQNLIKFPGFASWFFLLWVFPFSEIGFNFRISTSLFFCTLIFWRLLATEQSMENKKFFFDIGILLSISGFFYPPSLLLAGFLIFIFFYVQAFNIKSFLLFLIGFTFPLVVGIQILFLTDQLGWLNTYYSAFCIDFWNYSIWGLIPIGLMIALSWLDHLSNSNTQDINKRHKYFLTFLYFINLLVMILLFGSDFYPLLAFLGLPIAVFFTRFVQYQQTIWIQESILWGFLVVMAAFFFRAEIFGFYQEILGNVAF